MLHCTEILRQSLVMGHEPPRHLTGSAVEVALIAAAPNARRQDG
jgi:hypothetical protein